MEIFFISRLKTSTGVNRRADMVVILSDWLSFKVFLSVLHLKGSDLLKHLVIKDWTKHIFAHKIDCKVTPILLLKSCNCLWTALAVI